MPQCSENNDVDIVNENTIQVNFEQAGKHIMCQVAGVAHLQGYHVLHQVSELQMVSFQKTEHFHKLIDHCLYNVSETDRILFCHIHYALNITLKIIDYTEFAHMKGHFL